MICRYIRLLFKHVMCLIYCTLAASWLLPCQYDLTRESSSQRDQHTVIRTRLRVAPGPFLDSDLHHIGSLHGYHLTLTDNGCPLILGLSAEFRQGLVPHDLPSFLDGPIDLTVS